ncbi:VWA-like domain-containing protein [Faecalimonas umbilicata]|nr:VWA-like domain-containing protein [Faecalimonas umbilicata]
MEKKSEQEQNLKNCIETVSEQILKIARNELYLNMRFLDVSLSSMAFVMDEAVRPLGTDGFCLYYHPQYLGGMYREERILVNRAYLHIVLHCIFRHLIRREGREKERWNLSCDIVAESMIDSMQHRSVRRSKSWLRRETYRKLRERMKVLTPDRVYGVLERWELSEQELRQLAEEFYVDDHCYWPEDDDRKRQNEIENRWKNQSEQMETEMETFSKEASQASGNLLEQVRVENRERFDYRQFLRKFSVLKEEMTVDEDSFDYVFYSYGLRLYGNMPLIEPQEWKEVQKVEEFVIVIDTSMSCSGDLVKKFLEETYSVLSENNSFFRRVNIHIIQCDDEVKTDQKITSQEELKEYMDNLELWGEGGTDFRPAFAYVEELKEKHEFSRLRGLIYFTDGQGIYPAKKPGFETAFVFMKEDYEDVNVPPWAMKLILEEERYDGYKESEK